MLQHWTKKKPFLSQLLKTVYLLRGNVRKKIIYIVEPQWESSDNYTILYDMNKMTMIRRGWSGTFRKKTTEPLKSNPLAEFMAQWRGHYLDPATPCFWQPPGFSEPRTKSAPAMKTSGHHDLQTVPNHAPVPGWFVSPCEGCEEFTTDIAILGHLFSRTFSAFIQP